jgi:hypothetical protein
MKKDKLPLLSKLESMNEENLAIPGKGNFVVNVSAENNYIYLHMIPDSKMLDALAEMGQDEFIADAEKYLTNKFNVEFRVEYGHHAGYKFKFHVTELIKDIKDII